MFGWQNWQLDNIGQNVYRMWISSALTFNHLLVLVISAIG